jgi:Clustered mitochondria
MSVMSDPEELPTRAPRHFGSVEVPAASPNAPSEADRVKVRPGSAVAVKRTAPMASPRTIRRHARSRSDVSARSLDMHRLTVSNPHTLLPAAFSPPRPAHFKAMSPVLTGAELLRPTSPLELESSGALDGDRWRKLVLSDSTGGAGLLDKHADPGSASTLAFSSSIDVSTTTTSSSSSSSAAVSPSVSSTTSSSSTTLASASSAAHLSQLGAHAAPTLEAAHARHRTQQAHHIPSARRSLLHSSSPSPSPELSRLPRSRAESSPVQESRRMSVLSSRNPHRPKSEGLLDSVGRSRPSPTSLTDSAVSAASSPSLTTASAPLPALHAPTSVRPHAVAGVDRFTGAVHAHVSFDDGYDDPVTGVGVGVQIGNYDDPATLPVGKCLLPTGEHSSLRYAGGSSSERSAVLRFSGESGTGASASVATGASDGGQQQGDTGPLARSYSPLSGPSDGGREGAFSPPPPANLEEEREPAGVRGFHHAAAVKDWNSEFQLTLEMQDPLERFDTLANLGRDFVHVAEVYGQIIISEYFLSFEAKTIKPVLVGGVAGGTQETARR